MVCTKVNTSFTTYLLNNLLVGCQQVGSKKKATDLTAMVSQGTQTQLKQFMTTYHPSFMVAYTSFCWGLINNHIGSYISHPWWMKILIQSGNPRENFEISCCMKMVVFKGQSRKGLMSKHGEVWFKYNCINPKKNKKFKARSFCFQFGRK